MRDKCLIFEPGYTGHRSEYVGHLMQFINDNPDLHGKYVFTLDERIAPFIKSLTIPNHFAVIYNNFDRKHKNSIERSFWQWDKISSAFTEDPAIREIIFMELDPYLVLINTSMFRKYKLSVRGILFQPYSHFKAKAGGINYFFKTFLKNLVTQKIVFSFNSTIDKCFILNDKVNVARMNRRTKNVFHFLPDPLDNAAPIADAVLTEKFAAKYKIGTGKKTLLLFGQIDERKNLINIIDSIRLFPGDIKSSLRLVIAGKFNANVRERYMQYIDKYKGEIDIVYHDTPVVGGEREFVFEHCDLVLMVYKNFYSSSGVLGHAIRHGKRVIVSSLGLLKMIVTENGCGIAVDPMDAKSINQAANQMLFGNELLDYDNRKFVAEHSPVNFSKTLLKA
jgi:glycosyltransferase involved in cell wall biosynthesis